MFSYPSVVINIGTINVTRIENTSSLNIGRNYLRDFSSDNKSNQGLGTILGGTNSFPHSLNLVDDPDVMDMYCGPGSKGMSESRRMPPGQLRSGNGAISSAASPATIL